MNVLGRKVSVVGSRDRTKVGKEGVVVLETQNMLVIESGGRLLSVEKMGSAFSTAGKNEVVVGSDLAGRLEERLGRRR